MPRTKTKRGAAKRFRKTASGAFKRSKAFRRHLLSSKNRKRKRRLRKSPRLQGGALREVRRLLPY